MSATISRSIALSGRCRAWSQRTNTGWLRDELPAGHPERSRGKFTDLLVLDGDKLRTAA